MPRLLWPRRGGKDNNDNREKTGNDDSGDCDPAASWPDTRFPPTSDGDAVVMEDHHLSASPWNGDVVRRDLSPMASRTAALHDACATGRLSDARRLVEEEGGSSMIVRARDRLGSTALHVAAARGRLDLCRYLVEEAGCDATARNRRGHTPARVADLCERDPVVTRYLRRRAQARAQTKTATRGTENTTSLRHSQSASADTRKLSSSYWSEETSVSSDVSVEGNAICEVPMQQTYESQRQQTQQLPSPSSLLRNVDPHHQKQYGRHSDDRSEAEVSVDDFVAVGMRDLTLRRHDPTYSQQREFSERSPDHNPWSTRGHDDDADVTRGTSRMSISDLPSDCGIGILMDDSTTTTPRSAASSSSVTAGDDDDDAAVMMMMMTETIPPPVPARNNTTTTTTTATAKSTTEPLTTFFLQEEPSNGRQDQEQIKTPTLNDSFTVPTTTPPLRQNEADAPFSVHASGRHSQFFRASQINAALNERNSSAVRTTGKFPVQPRYQDDDDEEGTTTTTTTAAKQASVSSPRDDDVTPRRAKSSSSSPHAPSVTARPDHCILSMVRETSQTTTASSTDEMHDMAVAMLTQEENRQQDKSRGPNGKGNPIQDAMSRPPQQQQQGNEEERITQILGSSWRAVHDAQSSSFTSHHTHPIMDLQSMEALVHDDTATAEQQQETRIILQSRYAGFFVYFIRKMVDMLSPCASIWSPSGSTEATDEIRNVRIADMIEEAMDTRGGDGCTESANGVNSLLTLIAELDGSTRVSGVTRVVRIASQLARPACRPRQGGEALRIAVLRLARHLVRARATPRRHHRRDDDNGTPNIDGSARRVMENKGKGGRIRRKRFTCFRRLSESLHSLSSTSSGSLNQELLQIDKWAREEGYVAADIAMDILLRHDTVVLDHRPDEIIDRWAMAFIGFDTLDEVHQLPLVDTTVIPYNALSPLGVSASSLLADTVVFPSVIQEEAVHRHSASGDSLAAHAPEVENCVNEKHANGNSRYSPDELLEGEIESHVIGEMNDFDEATHEVQEMLAEEDDHSLTDSDKEAVLREMRALVAEQKETIMMLQKRLHRQMSVRGLGRQEQSLCEMKRDALSTLWKQHQEEVQKAQVLIEVGRKKKCRPTDNERGDSLSDLNKDSLTKLWNKHEQVQQTMALQKK